MASLVFPDSSGRQIVFPLERDRVSIGRSADNDIVSRDLRVSRHHASISRENSSGDSPVYRLRDEGSTLGIFVNQERVSESVLRDGDVIRIGDSLYSFVDLPADPLLQAPTLTGVGTQAPRHADLRGSALVAELQDALASLRRTVRSPDQDPRILDQCFSLVDERLEGLRGRLVRIERARIMMQTLYEVGKVLNSSYNRDNLIDLILDQAVQVVRAERGFLTLYDPETGRFTRRASRTMQDELGSDTGFSTGIALSVAKTGEPIVTTDAQFDERFRERQSVMNLNIRSALCVPLVDRAEKIMGVIYVDTRDSVVAFTHEDREFLMAFANYAAIAIENAALLADTASKARTEEELRQARKMDELKSQLISMVSHDVRTPLTSIKSYAEIIHDDLETLEPDKLRHFLDIINREAERLGRLVTNYLDLQKIEAGRMSLSSGSLDVMSMLQESLDTFRGAALEKQIRIELDIEDALPTIIGDRDRLLQVLANLLSNSLKFTSRGGSVRLSARRARLDGTTEAVRIAVQDSGPGIPADKLAGLFRPFSQIDEHRSEQKRGTGLGLYLSHEIVKLHGGRIGVTSEPPRGTEFHFLLPVSNR
ncbi:MAG: ATP-binding protein [Acidobacteriota bacterium]